MSSPSDCQCPESLQGKGRSSEGCDSGDGGGTSALAIEKQSRYFVGISPAVLFVASLSVLAFLVVAGGAVVVATTQAAFFLALPLASAAGGSFLFAAPERVPLLGSDNSDPVVLLLLRLSGVVAVAYAGSALLVGRSRCSKTRSAYLALVAGSLGALAAAFAADESSALAGAVGGDRAAVLSGVAAVAAGVGAVMTAAGPALTRKLQCGKPAEPGLLDCSW